jgi:hypothetical protein
MAANRSSNRIANADSAAFHSCAARPGKLGSRESEHLLVVPHRHRAFRVMLEHDAREVLEIALLALSGARLR